MIAITTCTASDSPAIAALWNTMAGIEESCWRRAPTVTAQDVDALAASGVTFVLAADAEEPLGFAFWQPAGNALLLEAIAAQTADVYYRLMVAYAEWGLARELTQGACEIGATDARDGLDERVGRRADTTHRPRPACPGAGATTARRNGCASRPIWPR